MSNKQRVVEILNGYYGEDRVDDQGNILIYWPEVTITNENDRSIDIKELYASINVCENGTLSGTFKLNRTEYTCTEWYNDYMHSHVNHIKKTFPNSFSTSCLGYGPIRDTMAYLNSNFDEDFWVMFALELDKYVHTESLIGGPYHRMENMNRLPETRLNEMVINLYTGREYHTFRTLSQLHDILTEFIPYVISKRPFRFSFCETYHIADTPYNIVIKLSNLFIEWFNSISDDEKKESMKTFMFNHNLLIKCKASNGVIRNLVIDRQDFSHYKSNIGRPLWTFKGKQLELNITDIPEDTEISIDDDPFLSILLQPNLAFYITYLMLNTINYRYGGKKDKYTTCSDKKAYYISTYNNGRTRAEDTTSVL